MGRFLALAVSLALACSVRASWYWPFGSDDDEKDPPRLSEIMEKASTMIDEASDLAADGKSQDAIAKYREVLVELDRIEAENPDRAKTPEFATLRNKRAYVSAAIDAMVMTQARQNAKAVAVSDTTELERKLAEEKRGSKKGKEQKSEKKEEKKAEKKKVEKKPSAEPAPERRPLTQKDQIIDHMESGRYEEASAIIEEMLKARPNDVKALNLKAAAEMAQDKMKEAERTLDQCIQSNPRSHYAYYNMALLMLKADPASAPVARRYYETGRAVGGPEDPQLEEMLR